MATYSIPLSPGTPAFTQRTLLDGRAYILDFRWNERESAWYLSLLDEHEDPILYGIKLVLNWPLLRRVVDPRRPPGSLMCVDPSGNDDSPGLQELGTRVELIYLDAEEIAANRGTEV